MANKNRQTMQKEFEAQKDEVKTYFQEICDEDPYGLDMHFFFNKVCSSIKTNGLEKTSEIYELDLTTIQQIQQ